MNKSFWPTNKTTFWEISPLKLPTIGKLIFTKKKQQFFWNNLYIFLQKKPIFHPQNHQIHNTDLVYVFLEIMDRSTFCKLDSVQVTCAHNINPPNKKFSRKKIFANYFFNFGQNLAQVKTIWPWWTKPISSIFLEFWEISPKVANHWETNKTTVFLE